MQWDVIHLALVDVDRCDDTLVLVWWQLVLVEIGTGCELLLSPHKSAANFMHQLARLDGTKRPIFVSSNFNNKMSLCYKFRVC